MNIRITENSVEVDGYVNAIERLSKPLHDRLGDFVERVKVGAFKKALERAEDVRILLNHDWNRDLGGVKDGTLELHEDAIGLHARATITDKDVIEQAKRGELRGWSFGFIDRDVEKGEENGLTVRNIKDLDLYEVSIINRDRIPAYDGTLIAVRAKDDSTALNVSDCVESEINTRVEANEAKPEATTNNHADEESGAVDYTDYQNIINEMKGD